VKLGQIGKAEGDIEVVKIARRVWIVVSIDDGDRLPPAVAGDAVEVGGINAVGVAHLRGGQARGAGASMGGDSIGGCDSQGRLSYGSLGGRSQVLLCI
jgi:hypothetical protein